MNRSDDFSKTVKEALAKRVNYQCSNPGCRKPTSGPSPSSSSNSISIGVAAHITAASPGGPRYNQALTSEQRQSADNGLWCCQNCARLIDTDAQAFPVNVLRAWREIAEHHVFQSMVSPSARQANIIEREIDFSWSCHQKLFSSHCLQLEFCISNEGNEPIREYAAKVFLPAQVAQHLRYHNPDDPLVDEILSFTGPQLMNYAGSHTVPSWNGQLSTVIPRAIASDYPLLPSGPSIPVAELDFGFTDDEKSFAEKLAPYEIQVEFWAGIKKRVSMRLVQLPDGSVTYRSVLDSDFSPHSLAQEKVKNILTELRTQLNKPGSSRGITKDSRSVVEAATRELVKRGFPSDHIRSWPADDYPSPVSQYYLEIIKN